MSENRLFAARVFFGQQGPEQLTGGPPIAIICYQRSGDVRPEISEDDFSVQQLYIYSSTDNFSKPTQ